MYTRVLGYFGISALHAALRYVSAGRHQLLFDGRPVEFGGVRVAVPEQDLRRGLLVVRVAERSGRNVVVPVIGAAGRRMALGRRVGLRNASAQGAGGRRREGRQGRAGRGPPQRRVARVGRKLRAAVALRHELVQRI